MALAGAVDALLAELGAAFRMAEAEAAAATAAGPRESEAARRRRAAAEERAQAALLGLDAALGAGQVDKALAVCRSKGAWRPGYSTPAAGVREFVATAARRRCWHVRGDGGTYLCVEGFCSCRSFVSRVTAQVPLCKHLLAVRLAQELDLVQTTEVKDEHFAQLLMT